MDRDNTIHNWNKYIHSYFKPEQRVVRKMLISAINKFTGERYDINKQLQELQKFVAQLDPNNSAVQHLLRSNVLFREDDSIITPQYKLMQTAIQNTWTN